MSEHDQPRAKEIDIHIMPELGKDTTLADIFAFFLNDWKGKILTMHYATSPQDEMVRESPIHMAGVLSYGEGPVVAIATEDALGQPTVHEFDGSGTEFCGSIYEANDFWFKDKSQPDVWWGIYHEPLQPYSVRLSDDD